MSRVLSALKGIAQALIVVGVVAGAVLLALNLLTGGGDERDAGDGAALALGPAESSWVPGQKGLAEYSEFAALFNRALPLAKQRRDAREKALEDLERRKIAAKKRAEAEARRRYLEAKRRAERLYQLALKRAAEQRRRQLEKIRKAREEAARRRRELEEKRKVRPGEECRLPGVKQKFECETGKLPLPEENR